MPCCRFDRCICIIDTDKLDKPREAFKRVKDCGKAGLISLAFDPHNNVLLAGSLDGVLRVWSVEGRCAGSGSCVPRVWRCFGMSTDRAPTECES
jgi:WD40 repeat protein